MSATSTGAPPRGGQVVVAAVAKGTFVEETVALHDHCTVHSPLALTPLSGRDGISGSGDSGESLINTGPEVVAAERCPIVVATRPGENTRRSRGGLDASLPATIFSPKHGGQPTSPKAQPTPSQAHPRPHPRPQKQPEDHSQVVQPLTECMWDQLPQPRPRQSLPQPETPPVQVLRSQKPRYHQQQFVDAWVPGSQGAEDEQCLETEAGTSATGKVDSPFNGPTAHPAVFKLSLDENAVSAKGYQADLEPPAKPSATGATNLPDSAMCLAKGVTGKVCSCGAGVVFKDVERWYGQVVTELQVVMDAVASKFALCSVKVAERDEVIRRLHKRLQITSEANAASVVAGANARTSFGGACSNAGGATSLRGARSPLRGGARGSVSVSANRTAAPPPPRSPSLGGRTVGEVNFATANVGISRGLAGSVSPLRRTSVSSADGSVNIAASYGARIAGKTTDDPAVVRMRRYVNEGVSGSSISSTAGALTPASQAPAASQNRQQKSKDGPERVQIAYLRQEVAQLRRQNADLGGQVRSREAEVDHLTSMVREMQISTQRQLGLCKKQLNLKEDTLQSMQEELMNRMFTVPSSSQTADTTSSGGQHGPVSAPRDPRNSITRSLSAFARHKEQIAGRRGVTASHVPSPRVRQSQQGVRRELGQNYGGNVNVALSMSNAAQAAAHAAYAGVQHQAGPGHQQHAAVSSSQPEGELVRRVAPTVGIPRGLAAGGPPFAAVSAVSATSSLGPSGTVAAPPSASGISTPCAALRSSSVDTRGTRTRIQTVRRAHRRQ